MAKKLQTGRVETILDVRKPSEFLAQHLLDATNFPLDYINRNMQKLNRYDTYHLHCAGGYRSMIAASILKARGFDNLVDVTGGWGAIEKTEMPKSDYVCPTTLPQETLDEAVSSVI